MLRNVISSNDRFSHSGQPKLRDLQNKSQAAGSNSSRLIRKLRKRPWKAPFLPFLLKDEDSGHPGSRQLENDLTTPEDGKFSPGTVLGQILDIADSAERNRYFIRMRTRVESKSLQMVTVHYLVRGHFPRVKSNL